MRTPARRRAWLAAAAVVSVSASPTFGQQSQSSPAERATFYLLVGGDTIAVEHEMRTPSRLQGDFTDVKRGLRVRYDAALAADGTEPRVELWAYRSPTDSVAFQHASYQLQGDTMLVEAGGTGAQRIATRAGALVYSNPSSALLEQALIRAKALGGTTAQVPLFQSAGGQTVPLSVTWLGTDSAVLSLGGVEMRASVRPTGRLLGLAVPSQNARAVRVAGTRAASSSIPTTRRPLVRRTRRTRSRFARRRASGSPAR